MDAFEFQSAIDGWTIHGYHWPAGTVTNGAEAKANVLISHGMAEHALRYDRFASALNQAGYDVWALDHRAHGRTSGPQGPGDFGEGGWDALVEDLEQLRATIADQSALPIMLFGHSMGAAAAQQYAPTYSQNIHALILSGSTLRHPGEAIPVYNEAFQPVRTDYDWLSRDPEEVDLYIRDPLCGFEGQTIKNGMDRTDPRRVDPARLVKIRNNLPVLLVAGDADPVNNQLAGLDLLETLWREAGVKQIDRQVYQGGRHEMLNEINRDEVTNNMITWLDNHL